MAPQPYMLAAETDASRPETKESCILAWSLTRRTRANVLKEQLEALHKEIQQCAALVGARQIEVCAMSGMLRCEAVPSARVTCADTALRCGQLLCRWATQQEPELGLNVGLACGTVQSFQLPSRADGFFGPAVAAAKQMADAAPRDTCVHFGNATRERLRVFERLTTSIKADSTTWQRMGTMIGGDMSKSLQGVAAGGRLSPSPTKALASKGLGPTGTQGTAGLRQDTYFLEPWVEAVDVDGELRTQATVDFGAPALTAGSSRLETPSKTVDLGRLAPGKALEKLREMSLEEFETFLMSYDVELEPFGKGYAKTTESFKKELVEDRKSYLCAEKGKLQRNLELVRVTLYARGPDGTDRYLRLANEILEDGRTRARHQKLACVVTEGMSWKQAVMQNINDRFGITEKHQEDNFSAEGSWYKEEKFYSPSYPGIKTVYLTHEVRMRIVNPKHPDLVQMGLPDMRSFSTRGGGKTHHWCWTSDSEEPSNVEVLTQLLQMHSIPHTDFEPAAFSDLVSEVYETKMSSLVVRNQELFRCLDIVKVWVEAEILSVPHYLMQKSKVQYDRRGEAKERPISMRIGNNQTWREAVAQALARNLGMGPEMQEECTVLDESTYMQCEEIEYSKSYPGLKSVYRIHEVHVRVANIHRAHVIGLPEGNSFSFCRQENQNGEGVAPPQVVIAQFAWKTQQELSDKIASRAGFLRTLADEKSPAFSTSVATASMSCANLGRFVKAPDPMEPPPFTEWKSRYLVQELMRGKTTDWARARAAARRIRDPHYSCGDYFQDVVAAFPELHLYIVSHAEMNSGRSPDEEYQRTMGAMFAVYWLMRLDIDGAQGFSFGVDVKWQSLTESPPDLKRPDAEVQKRDAFFKQAEWHSFDELLQRAGLRTKDGHNEDRVLAMLVLTAIHDIMKVAPLLPRVHESVTDFNGYRGGEEIGDHDVALGYLLTYVPDALPSYRDLPKRSQDSVKFTQGQMQYNMGWLVQAEAPPGHLFRHFTSIIRSGQADPSDVSFYFVHWLTDLAGAEGRPMEGAEKFVLKFPLKVLASFLNSFQFVQHLDAQSETHVFEDYLCWRWRQMEPSLGAPPASRGAVARMRLVVMAQGGCEQVVQAYDRLPDADRDVLDEELARTGCKDQSYSCEFYDPAGPSFLVYYAPALMQRNCATNPSGALAVLAEVLRQARVLWPLKDAKTSQELCDNCGAKFNEGDAFCHKCGNARKETLANETVVVRIDAIKDQDLESISILPAGDFWALQKSSSMDCQVKRLSLHAEQEDNLQVDWMETRVLHFQDYPHLDPGADQQKTPVRLASDQALARKIDGDRERFDPTDVIEEEDFSQAWCCGRVPSRPRVR